MIGNHVWKKRLLSPQKIKLLAFFCIIFSQKMISIDDHHFYRASFLFAEPRFEKNGLGTFETWIGVGETCESRNSQERIVPLFDLFGASNMRLLGAGVPNKDPNNPADLALINLEKLPGNDCFGFISIPGSFKVIESGFRFFQNFAAGFFTQMQLPIRSFRIIPQPFVDLSPDSSSSFPNKSSPEWQEFLRQFNNILDRYDLSYGCIQQSNLGDFIWTLGWTRNFQETEELDYLDTTFQAGILFPAAPDRNENQIFSVPFGYNGHWGFVSTFEMSYGAYEWFTMGAHAGIIAFLTRQKNNVRVSTACGQTGMIRLATIENAVLGKGALWDLGGYIKADHLGGALSLTVGYTFANQDGDSVCACAPQDVTIINPDIVNANESLQGWNMHTVHLFIEYDFSKECWRAGPRLGMLFNAQVGGKRVFKNNIVGGTFGLEIIWSL